MSAAPGAWLLVGALLAGTPGAREPLRETTGTAAPATLAMQPPRLHLVVDEALEADLLRPLVAPGITVWLKTRSNAVRDSMREVLAGFDEAYVQLRPPIRDAHVDQLSRSGTVGVWLEATGLDEPALSRLGPRRVAVSLEGELSEALAERVERRRPFRVLWEPTPQVSVMEWARFRSLGGRARKHARLRAATAQGYVCEPDAATAPERSKGAGPIAPWLDVGLWLSLAGQVFPCGAGARVQIRPEIDDSVLRWMFSRQPALELETSLERPEQASQVLGLLRRVGLLRPEP